MIVLMVKSMVLTIIKANLMDLKCYKTYTWLRVISINGTAYKMNKYRKKKLKNYSKHNENDEEMKEYLKHIIEKTFRIFMIRKFYRKL